MLLGDMASQAAMFTEAAAECESLGETAGRYRTMSDYRQSG